MQSRQQLGYNYTSQRLAIHVGLFRNSSWFLVVLKSCMLNHKQTQGGGKQAYHGSLYVGIEERVEPRQTRCIPDLQLDINPFQLYLLDLEVNSWIDKDGKIIVKLMHSSRISSCTHQQSRALNPGILCHLRSETGARSCPRHCLRGATVWSRSRRRRRTASVRLRSHRSTSRRNNSEHNIFVFAVIKTIIIILYLTYQQHTSVCGFRLALTIYTHKVNLG